MAIHDAWARRTPYELFLPDPEFADERFTAIREEAAEHGSDLSDPEQFVMLMAVGEALRDLRGPAEDPERIRQHGLLLFHAFHFREAGEPLWLLSTPAARYAVETAAGPASGGRPPSPAGYLQLPQHLFWGRTGGEDAARADAANGSGEGDAAAPREARPSPESMDGIFWVGAAGRVSVLSVLGLRGDRPGFSVIPLPPLDLGDAAVWAATDMREVGEDFRSDMPGAEIESLYEVRTAGEILKLLARAWSLMEPDATEREDPPQDVATDAAADGGQAGPPRSALPYYRVVL